MDSIIPQRKKKVIRFILMVCNGYCNDQLVVGPTHRTKCIREKGAERMKLHWDGKQIRNQIVWKESAKSWLSKYNTNTNNYNRKPKSQISPLRTKKQLWDIWLKTRYKEQQNKVVGNLIILCKYNGFAVVIESYVW